MAAKVIAVVVCCYCTLAAAAESQRAATAAAYPTKPIRMIVPYAPGGGSDIVARIVEGLTTNGLSTIPVRRERERCGLPGSEPLVRLFENAQGMLHVIRMFFLGLGIPLAPRRREEISTVNVDGGRDLIQRIRDRVNDRRTQRDRIFRTELLRPVCCQPALGTTKERVALATSVDADNSPHAVIVRLDDHTRSPTQVENRDVGCAVNRLHT